MVSAVAAAVVLCVIFLPGHSELQRRREENDIQNKRIRLLEEQNERLREELIRLKRDPEYVEKKAREKLGIVKKGETVYKR